MARLTDAEPNIGYCIFRRTGLERVGEELGARSLMPSLDRSIADSVNAEMLQLSKTWSPRTCGLLLDDDVLTGNSEPAERKHLYWF